MATYTYGQLEQLWLDTAKGTQYATSAWAALMAAIGMAESSGEEGVINSIGACGLWQIHPYENGCTDARTNARMALGKLQSQGLGAWEAYTNGSYRKFLRSGINPASLPTGGGGDSVVAAQTTSFLGDVSLNPIGIIEGAWKTISGIVTKPLDIATSVTSLAKDFNALVAMINAVLKDIEWLFVPSHWVRIFCFLFGVGALIPGVWALVKTGSGQQGDITLAIGILMITIGGILLFLAFHNLPTDVQDLGGLLGYISKGVQTGQAPADAVKTGAA